MKKAFIAKLIVGGALLQGIATGLSCLGAPVQGAPIYVAQGNLVQALQNLFGT
jgi:hypothetical protein